MEQAQSTQEHIIFTEDEKFSVCLQLSPKLVFILCVCVCVCVCLSVYAECFRVIYPFYVGSALYVNESMSVKKKTPTCQIWCFN